MAQPGWVSIHRKIWECEIWVDDEPFDKRSAWVDILLLANHETKSIVMGMKTVTIERGSFVTSQAKLCSRWHWGVGRVRRYLDLLQELGMITWKAERKWTTVKVHKYEVYQDLRQESGMITEGQRNDSESLVETNNNVNNVNNVNNIPTNVVVVSKDISKGGNYSPFDDLQYTLGWLPTEFQAQFFKDLYQEVGEDAFHKALVKAAKANARNLDYIEKAARGIANGDDFDEKPKVTGSYDLQKAIAMAEELEKQHA